MARAAAACPGTQDYQAHYRREKEDCGSASKRVQMAEWLHSGVTSNKRTKARKRTLKNCRNS